MAGKDSTIINRPETRFYLYMKRDNKLKMERTKIYSPFNVKTKGYETDKFDFIEPTYVEFEKWLFTLRAEDVGDVLYDQIKEFLSLYNNVWGRLTKWDKSSAIKNGKMFSGKTSLYYVSMEKPKTEKDQQVKIVTKEVEIAKIPRGFAQSLSHVQLAELCKEWDVTIPDDIEKDVRDSVDLQSRYLELLKDRLID